MSKNARLLTRRLFIDSILSAFAKVQPKLHFQPFDPFKHTLRMDQKAFMLGSPLTLIDKEESNTTQEDPQFPGDLSEVSQDCFKEYQQEQTQFFKACYDFLLKLSQLLHRGQFIVNTAMVFVLKVSRTCDFKDLNKFILSAASFHLAAKTKDEPVVLP